MTDEVQGGNNRGNNLQKSRDGCNARFVLE